MGNNHIAQPTL